MSYVCVLPGGLQKARIPPCQGREKQLETRAGPGPPQQQQKTWGAAPPGGQRGPPQVSSDPFGHHTGRRCPKSWSLWLCLPCHHWDTEPGDGSLTPGFGLLQHSGVLGQQQLMDAHAAARTQKHFCTHTACAVSTGTACAELAVPPRPGLCLQEEVKGRELPPYQMEAVLRGWTAQLLPSREVWEQVGPETRSPGLSTQHPT